MTRSTKLFEKKSKNGVKHRFGFLDDQHRICVALTRQKRCLIVCGDKEMLKDKDAEENIRQITPRLRDIDKIHLVSCGEFEDLLPKSLIVKTVNSHFKNFLTIREEDLISEIQTAKVLEELFKQKGLHEFKKAEFAKLVRENISNNEDVSLEIKTIIRELQY